MKYCIAGKNNIAVDILLYILKKGISKKDIFIIINQTDDGIDSWQRSLLKKSQELNLNIVKLEDVYNIENLIFLSLEFDKIINPKKFKTSHLYNIHFSLLPKYKGMYTSILPILNNEKETGVTFHKIDSGIDTGEIIEQLKFKINLTDSARDLYHNYISYGTNLVIKNLNKLLIGEILPSYQQSFLDSSYYSKKSIDFSNIKLELNQTAIYIHNWIRGFNFREYQVLEVFNQPIISSEIINSSSRKKAGEIISEDDISITIATIDYDLVLYKDKSEELFLACQKGDLDLIKRLILIPNIINVQNQKGWTPLIIAIYNGYYEIVTFLLDNGADINITNFNGTTTLMYAKSAYVINKNEKVLNEILNATENILKRDYLNKNVLDYCQENNELEVLEIIKGKL